MFAALGRFVVRRPWWVIGAWVVVAVAVILTAPKLKSTSDEASFLPSHYESIQASNLQTSAFPHAATPAAIIVLERADGAALTADDSAKVASIGAALNADHVKDVTAMLVAPPSPHRLIQTIYVQMPEATSPGDKSQANAAQALRTDLQQKLAGTDLKGGVTGTAAQQLDQQKSGNKAMAIVGIVTVLLILVLLLVIFRSPLIALLPIVTIGLASQVANGFIGWANEAFNLKADSSITELLIVVLFGVGTDYILFLMFRYRERLRAGEDPKTALVSAVTRVGEAIASAAGTVIVAFLVLSMSTLGLFKALGPALAIAVAVTLITALTLIPAVVSLLGTRIFWPSKGWRREPTGARFGAVGNALGRRPARFAAASGIVLVALAVASFWYHPTFDLAGSSSTSAAESSVYSKEMLKDLPAGAAEPTQVFLRSTTAAPLTTAETAEYRGALLRVDGVGQVAPPQLSQDRTVAYFEVTLRDKPESSAAITLVGGPLRAAAHASAPPGTTAVVGGITAIYVDIKKAVNHDYTVVFPIAALLIMLILGALLRSVVAPWYLMISVGLGFAATLGTSVLVFEGAEGQPGLMFMLPIIMYLFVVALGTDYNILMVARLREEAREGRSPRDAAAMALRHTGPTVAAAGVILAGTFASLMLGGNTMLSQMGFATSFGIAVAAFVMAMFFTPSLTALIGHTAWWPGHGDSGGHDGQAPDAVLVDLPRQDTGEHATV
jgi:RND superfamily putative drug exporter